MGYVPLFGSHEGYGFRPGQIPYYLVIGLVGGVFGRAYASGFYGITRVFRRIRLPRAVKPALGGLAVGALGLVIPQVLGTGYGWVQRAMGPSLLAIPTPAWSMVIEPPSWGPATVRRKRRGSGRSRAGGRRRIQLVRPADSPTGPPGRDLGRVQRGEELRMPTADTCARPGDRVSLLTPAAQVVALRKAFAPSDQSDHYQGRGLSAGGLV